MTRLGVNLAATWRDSPPNRLPLIHALLEEKPGATSALDGPVMLLALTSFSVENSVGNISRSPSAWDVLTTSNPHPSLLNYFQRQIYRACPLTEKILQEAIKWVRGNDEDQHVVFASTSLPDLVNQYLSDLSAAIPTDMDYEKLFNFVKSHDWETDDDTMDELIEGLRDDIHSCFRLRSFIHDHLALSTKVVAHVLDGQHRLTALDCVLAGFLPDENKEFPFETYGANYPHCGKSVQINCYFPVSLDEDVAKNMKTMAVKFHESLGMAEDHNVLHYLRSEYERLVRECNSGGDGVERRPDIPNLESGVMGLMDVLHGNAGEQTLPSAQKLMNDVAKSFEEILLFDNDEHAGYNALNKKKFPAGPMENIPTLYFDLWTENMDAFIHNQLNSSSLVFFKDLSTKGKKTQRNQKPVNFFYTKTHYSPTSNLTSTGHVFKNAGNLSPLMEYGTILRLTRISEMTGIALGDFFSKYSKVTIGKEEAKSIVSNLFYSIAEGCRFSWITCQKPNSKNGNKSTIEHWLQLSIMKSVIRERCKCIVEMDPDPDLFRQAKEKLLEEANKDIEFFGQHEDLLDKFKEFFEDWLTFVVVAHSIHMGKISNELEGLVFQDYPSILAELEVTENDVNMSSQLDLREVPGGIVEDPVLVDEAVTHTTRLDHFTKRIMTLCDFAAVAKQMISALKRRIRKRKGAVVNKTDVIEGPVGKVSGQSVGGGQTQPGATDAATPGAGVDGLTAGGGGEEGAEVVVAKEAEVHKTGGEGLVGEDSGRSVGGGQTLPGTTTVVAPVDGVDGLTAGEGGEEDEVHKTGGEGPVGEDPGMIVGGGQSQPGGSDAVAPGVGADGVGVVREFNNM